MNFAGEINGKIISATGYNLDKIETDDVYWLNWHYTHKDFEGQGIGGKLLEHMIEIMSPKARKFYVNMG